MADSSSLCPLDPLVADSNSKMAVAGERRHFILTEAQRVFIQHHLPKTFTLVPVPAGYSRINSNSKTLLEDSRAFCERKRGRPEGSTRKHLNSKAARERKSARIASVARPSYASLNEKSNRSSHSSSPAEEGADNFSEKGQAEQEQLLDACQEVSLEEGLRETEKQCKIQGNIDNDQAAKNEEEKKQQPCPAKEQQAVETKQTTRKLSKKKSSKQASLPIENIPEGELLQTPMRKEQQLKDFAKELKTEPSNKDFSKEMLRFQPERTILRRLKSHREILPFLEPVDEARDGAPNYYKEILSPIDLQTIEFKLTTGIYKSGEDFHADVRLMWANAKSYNRRNPFMQQATEQLEAYYLHLLTRPRCGRKKKQ